MSDKVRIGVVGTGGVAFGRHFPAFQEAARRGDAEIVAVADPVDAGRARAAAQYGIPHAFADYRDLLCLPGLDAVSVCTPNVLHEEITLAALAAGKHVMCEKPMAMSYAGARRMEEAALSAGVRTGVNFRYRYIPSAMFVKDLIQSGELGEVYHVYVDYFGGGLGDPNAPMRWRMQRSQTGTGALGDFGSHIVDLCRHWLGEIDSLTGHFRTFITERPLDGGGVGQVDVDDAASFMAKFASGAMGVFNCTRYATGRNNHQRAEIYGSKGGLVYEIDKWDRGGDQLQVCLGPGQARVEGFATVKVPPEYLAGNPSRPMLDFVEGVKSGRDICPTFHDGVRCQEVLEAVEISDRERTWVKLPLGDS